MKTNLRGVFGLIFAVLASSASSFGDELHLRPLGPVVDRYLKAETPDAADLAYICRRGAALYTAHAGTVQGTAENDADRQLATTLRNRAVPFYQAALAAGIIARNDPAAAQEELLQLVDHYARTMARSRKLNDEILSAPVRKDLAALRQIEPLVIRFVAEMDSPSPSK